MGEVLVIDTGMATASVTDSAGNTLRNGLPRLEGAEFPGSAPGCDHEAEIMQLRAAPCFTELHAYRQRADGGKQWQ
ncbi:MAG: hypothetical protein ACLVHV_06370 [Oscillospiraceae bacterium]